MTKLRIRSRSHDGDRHVLDIAFEGPGGSYSGTQTVELPDDASDEDLAHAIKKAWSGADDDEWTLEAE